MFGDECWYVGKFFLGGGDLLGSLGSVFFL